MANVNISVSMPDEVYFDVQKAAQERGVPISRMVAYYTVQGYGLERRGFHVVGAPHDNRYLSPPPRSWLLPVDLVSPRESLEKKNPHA